MIEIGENLAWLIFGLALLATYVIIYYLDIKNNNQNNNQNP